MQHPTTPIATRTYGLASKLALLFAVLTTTVSVSGQTNNAPKTDVGDRMLTQYFQLETASLSTDVVTPGMTLPELEEQQSTDRKRLAEMLGLDPMPERTPLKPVIVSTEQRDGFRVQRLHFQPSPGLYVAANYYLPPKCDEPLPTILYVCGHANTVKDGVRPGNKAAYHHHGVWFARNGYTCLVIDTIQLGEFPGQHHGTYRLGKWWWNNRGYTPAGVEAWTGMRALDYLETRPEVDADRFGVTGRSGGGVYSWWIAALDKRIKVAVPVAGITTLHNHVVDGCVEGHCDCMYMINTYRWDYGRVAALVAPRPLLISNTDKDSIFPLDGVVQIHRQVRDVYELYGEPNHLGLQITEGPHKDTQELRVHAFRWFTRFLRDDHELIRMPADKCIELTDLAVFDTPPADERVTTADQWFVPEVQDPDPNWQESLLQKTFAGWPSGDQIPALDTKRIATSVKDGIRCDVYQFDSQQPFRLPLFVLSAEPEPKEADPQETKPAKDSSAEPPSADANNATPNHWTVEVLGQEAWEEVAGGLASILPKQFPDAVGSDDRFQTLSKRLKQDPTGTLVLFPPRGIGPTQWSGNDTKRGHIRRRFMLLGQTLDGMRIWDLRRAIAAVRSIPEFDDAPLTLRGSDHAAAWILYASLFDQPVTELELIHPPSNHQDGITLLNVSRVVDMFSIMKQAESRSKLNVWSDVASEED
ncbi:alpha/beta hydrolase family protein [Rubripirellula lacrimiformis]|uniref:alpha/beta hydrolase family protein n=1 Tax=Rubripirellula lacrimiformis TaxID=1930273 RepID=UPI001C54CDD7|nr:alpha/beta hydrolase family protein [Rubripirellula lacrimiformis]